MVIKQIIKYYSKNKYFCGFLNYILNETKLNGYVKQKQKQNEIILLLDNTDTDRIEKFSKITSKYLPHSIFLGDIKTFRLDKKLNKKANKKAKKKLFTSPNYDIALCPRCMEDLTRVSSQKYLDDTIVCCHYCNKAKKQKTDLALYSPHYSKHCTLLLCKTSKIDDLFIATDDEKKVLFSIEKPSIKLTIKDEFLKQTIGKNYIFVKSPYNVKSSLVGLNAKDSEIDYLFFKDLNETKAVVIQNNISLIKDNRVSSKLINFDKQADMNRFLNIANEQGNKNNAIGANMSLQHGISFFVSNNAGHKKVIKFQEFNLKISMQNMKEKKSKLLENFFKKHKNIIKKLKSKKKYNLFEVLSIILELKEKSFQSVCDKSLEFRGNGGLKIDMNFNDDGFDYESFISSIMSFKLANTQDSYLAYSIFEAYGNMVISNLNQLKKKFTITNFVFMGDMFESTILYSAILSKFSFNNPYFSKSFTLDD